MAKNRKNKEYDEEDTSGYDYEEEYDEESDEEYEYEDRAYYRHQRRIRNQIIAYVVMILIIAGIIIGGYIGVKKLMGSFSLMPDKHAEQLQEELLEMENSERMVIESPEEVE